MTPSTLGVGAMVLGIWGCQISSPITSQHPSVQAAPASVGSSLEERRSALFAAARADLSCERVEVVLTFDRRYANTATARYVVEGCGKRALYAETCEDYPSCRYLVLSILEIPSRGSHGPAVTAPTSAPAPTAAPPPTPVPTPPRPDVGF